MVTCTECERKFRTESGPAWHLEHIHGQSRVKEPEPDNHPAESTAQIEDIRQTVEALVKRVDDCEKAIKELMSQLKDVGIRCRAELII